jgi:hypothetical protein
MLAWQGFRAVIGKRVFRITRSHGNWLVLEEGLRGGLKAGEYFPYGPGALDRAKDWCEMRAQSRVKR